MKFWFCAKGQFTRLSRTDYLGITSKINWVQVEITEFANVLSALRAISPDEIYNLAAQSFVADSFEFPHLTNQINYESYLNILESIKILGLECSVYQASTSEMFGTTEEQVLNEQSPFAP